MAVNVRLSPKTERALRALAPQKGLSRSDLVREAITAYGAGSSAVEDSSRPYDAWMDVIGVVSLGARDAGRTTGDQFAAVVRERRRARHSR